MKLNCLSNSELTLRLEKLVRSERKITHLILNHILEFETRRLYAGLGFDSMFSYLTKHLGYSESSAYRRLQSARLLKKLPEVAAQLESGALNLSQLTEVQKCLREESKKGQNVSLNKTQAILEKLENCNSFETQRILAWEFDRPIQNQELAKPQKDDSVRLEITFTKEQFEELKKAKNLLSHICHEGNWSDVLVTLARRYNRSKIGKASPTKKPKASLQINSEVSLNINSNNTRQSEAGFDQVTPQRFLLETPLNLLVPSEKMMQPFSASVKIIESQIASHGKIEVQIKTKSNAYTEIENKGTQRGTLNPIGPTKRSYLSIKLRRQILKDADDSCEYRSPQGIRCGSQYQLQADHRIPLAFGGGNGPQNLRVLCRTHNLYAFKISEPKKLMG